MKTGTNQGSDACGLFDFMSKSIGITVLHPGGYTATNELLAMTNLNQNSAVLDLACGAGTTTIHIAKQYQCAVTGIDLSEELIAKAKQRITNKQKISFSQADALNLPFPDASFDCVVSQAFFILIDDKEKALSEIFRILKPGGQFASLELSWIKTPSADAYNELVSKTCSAFIPRVIGYAEWEKLFSTAGFSLMQKSLHPMSSRMLQMISDEGIINAAKIIFRIMKINTHRKRMMNLQKTFAKHNDTLGYALFAFKK